MTFSSKFSSIEKLKSKKSIGLLFRRGKSMNAFPMRVVYLPKEENTGVVVNVGVSIPKKKIKLAVNRNVLKRRIREAYRLNCEELKKHLEDQKIELNVMFVYTSKQISSYEEIENKIKVILTRLTGSMSEEIVE